MIKFINLSFVLIYFVISTACSKQQYSKVTFQGNKFEINDAIINGKIIQRTDSSSSNYQVKGAFINRDTLFVSLQYGGGCGYAHFHLNAELLKDKICKFRIIANIDDKCRALVNKQFYFIIKDYKSFKIKFVNKNGEIVF